MNYLSPRKTFIINKDGSLYKKNLREYKSVVNPTILTFLILINTIIQLVLVRNRKREIGEIFRERDIDVFIIT